MLVMTFKDPWALPGKMEASSHSPGQVVSGKKAKQKNQKSSGKGENFAMSLDEETSCERVLS